MRIVTWNIERLKHKKSLKSCRQYEEKFKKAYRACQISSRINTEIGFKDYLIYWFEDMYSQQKAGFPTKKEAEKAREKTIAEVNAGDVQSCTMPKRNTLFR